MLLLDRLSDGGDEGGDFGLEIWMGAKFSDAADDGAADNDSIAFLGDLSGLFGGGNAESDGDGEVRVGFDFANLGTDAVREASLLAGDAFAGDVVNEALCGFRNQLHAFGRCGGSNESNGQETVGLHELGVACGFIWGKIEDQNAVRAGGGSICMELVEAIDINRVQISKEDDRDFRGRADLFHCIKHSQYASSGIDGATRCRLDRGPIGKGIGKGDAEFDDVHA